MNIVNKVIVTTCAIAVGIYLGIVVAIFTFTDRPESSRSFFGSVEYKQNADHVKQNSPSIIFADMKYERSYELEAVHAVINRNSDTIVSLIEFINSQQAREAVNQKDTWHGS